ncbi:hypothetical protein CGI71_24440, partial [Vibrio parahaemolyticus]
AFVNLANNIGLSVFKAYAITKKTNTNFKVKNVCKMFITGIPFLKTMKAEYANSINERKINLFLTGLYI